MADLEHDKGGEVRIHIDHHEYKSKTPTTGRDLYKLADIPAHRELFREVGGDHEDVEIPRDDNEVKLKNDEHFYSQKEVAIIVNGVQKEVVETNLSFDDLVKLAFEKPPYGPNTLFTITYRKGPKKNPDGTLTAGHSVRIKKGLVFNVTATDKS